MYKLGETIRFEGKFYSVTGAALTGATVTVNIYNPSGTLIVSAGAATERANGRYSYDYAPDVAGDWIADFATANANADLLSVSDRKRIVAATYFQTDVSALATQASVNALGSPMQASAYTSPDNATIAAIDGKADEIIEDIYYLTHNAEGDPIQRVIPLPASSDTCVIYEYCFASDGSTPLSSVNSSARITSLPYDYSDKLHSGTMSAGTYNASTGLLTWEVVRGAGVIVSIQEVGIFGNIIIPNAAQARIFDLIGV